MKRLTTDTPKDNFETMLNYVYGKDGWAHIRSDGEEDDVLLSKWAAEQCICHDGCEDMFRDGVLPEEVDTTICDCMMDFPGCPIALAYCFACQAVHLRDRLKMYEDILFSVDGKELISLDQLRETVSAKSNPPLTLEELRGMGAGPVYIVGRHISQYDIYCGYAISGIEQFYKAALPSDNYGKAWLAYRRKPEEGTT